MPAVEALEIRTLLDASGPRILGHTAEVQGGAFVNLNVTFNEPINPGSFSTEDVTIEGPSGSVTATGLSLVAGNTYRITFAPLSAQGTYQATVGPQITDADVNPMDQDQDGTNGDPSADTYKASFAILTSNSTIGETNATYHGADLLIKGTTVAIDGPHPFHSVHLVNGAVLTHSANTSTQIHSLNLAVAEQIVVDATSRIDVSGKGYRDRPVLVRPIRVRDHWPDGSGPPGQDGRGRRPDLPDRPALPPDRKRALPLHALPDTARH